MDSQKRDPFNPYAAPPSAPDVADPGSTQRIVSTGATVTSRETPPSIILQPGNPAASNLFWQVEYVPYGQPWAQPFVGDWTRLDAGSPFPYTLTRMLLGWDIVNCVDRYPYQQHAQKVPDQAALASVQPTPYGWLFDRPKSSLSIERVWYWLARTNGLIAERDIAAYALGWFRIDRSKGWQAYPTPQRIHGFHHPHIYAHTAERSEIDVPWSQDKQCIWQVAYVNLAAGGTAQQIAELDATTLHKIKPRPRGRASRGS